MKLLSKLNPSFILSNYILTKKAALIIIYLSKYFVTIGIILIIFIPLILSSKM